MSKEVKNLCQIITKRFGETGIDDAMALLENADEMSHVMGYLNTETYIEDVLKANFSIVPTSSDLKAYASYLKKHSLKDLVNE